MDFYIIWVNRGAVSLERSPVRETPKHFILQRKHEAFGWRNRHPKGDPLPHRWATTPEGAIEAFREEVDKRYRQLHKQMETLKDHEAQAKKLLDGLC